MSTSGGELLVGNGVGRGWWLVVDGSAAGAAGMTGSEGAAAPQRRVVAGPFADEVEASWAALSRSDLDLTRMQSIYGVRQQPGGPLLRRPSPQEHEWLNHLGMQLERLPVGWDTELEDDDPLITLVVEVTAALADAGLPLYDCAGTTEPGTRLGGACVIPDVPQQAVVVSWRQHDRMSIDLVRGPDATDVVHQVMTTAVAEVLTAVGMTVELFGGGDGLLVRDGYETGS